MHKRFGTVHERNDSFTKKNETVQTDDVSSNGSFSSEDEDDEVDWSLPAAVPTVTRATYVYAAC
jgi:hypothetical protein